VHTGCSQLLLHIRLGREWRGGYELHVYVCFLVQPRHLLVEHGVGDGYELDVLQSFLVQPRHLLVEHGIGDEDAHDV
jgi:hypothetical protein